MMRAQLKDFRRKFGRDPKPGEPVFFDPDKDEPTPLDPGKVEADMLEVLRKTGTAPQIIYAYRKTGLLIVEGFEENYPPEAVKEWKAAIDEYFKLEREAGGDARAGMQPAGENGPEPRPTKIPELKDRPWAPEDSEAMEACLNVINERIADKQRLNVLVELAAVLLAITCDNAFQTAVAQGHSEEAPERYEFFEQLVIKRALELNGRHSDT
jgi:hypothetical protein